MTWKKTESVIPTYQSLESHIVPFRLHCLAAGGAAALFDLTPPVGTDRACCAVREEYVSVLCFLCLSLPRTFRGATTTFDTTRFLACPTRHNARSSSSSLNSFCFHGRTLMRPKKTSQSPSLSGPPSHPAPVPDTCLSPHRIIVFRAMHAPLLDAFFVGGQQGARWGTLAHTERPARTFGNATNFRSKNLLATTHIAPAIGRSEGRGVCINPQ
jgi:hypothetical protein